MTFLRSSAFLLVLSFLTSSTFAAICPDGCVCTTTRDGLHRATCSDLIQLYKFTLRQKHHNINILDLSHNNITRLTHELDRLTEVVTLDLSTNGLTEINKFLHNAKKLVHLNLANNRIRKLSLTYLPTSVSSLDLTNNLLNYVPSDIGHLVSLEHLELDGNPLDCSCENILARDRLLGANVFIDAVKCATPVKIKGRSWLELKTKDICKVPKTEINPLEMMMGDQAFDAVRIGKETTELKSMALVAGSDLEDGNVIQGGTPADDDDNVQFMKVGRKPSSSDIEGSGEIESTTVFELIEAKNDDHTQLPDIVALDEEISTDEIQTTDDPSEGSGEGSGFLIIQEPIEKTNIILDEFKPTLATKIFEDDNNDTVTEYPILPPMTVYEGGPDWHSKPEGTSSTEKTATSQLARDTTVSEPIRIPEQSSTNDKPAPHKTGTYICIAIIVILLVGLIAFAIVKGQMRKRRDRRLMRQQKRDVEKASKEMVDMNKSLLGKPAVLEPPTERKVNGKYELVPTHEPHQKKNENGDVNNGIKHSDKNGIRNDSPRDTNQNKNSSKDNNLAEQNRVQHLETSFDSVPESAESRKDTHSLSSVDIFVPNDEDSSRINGNADLDISQPLINGDQNTDSDFLSPSREYVPVYSSPDMGRVRIKMTETPKPKTPVLVTRSRSNAGDIIITPSDGNNLKSTT